MLQTGALISGAGVGEPGRPRTEERSFLGAKRRGNKNGLDFDLGAFDLDGTVLRRNLRITGKTVAALQGLRERGMRLVVATGRRFEDARDYATKLGFEEHDPVICHGGSMVRRISGEPLLSYCNA